MQRTIQCCHVNAFYNLPTLLKWTSKVLSCFFHLLQFQNGGISKDGKRLQGREGDNQWATPDNFSRRHSSYEPRCSDSYRIDTFTNFLGWSIVGDTNQGLAADTAGAKIAVEEKKRIQNRNWVRPTWIPKASGRGILRTGKKEREEEAVITFGDPWSSFVAWAKWRNKEPNAGHSGPESVYENRTRTSGGVSGGWKTQRGKLNDTLRTNLRNFFFSFWFYFGEAWLIPRKRLLEQLVNLKGGNGRSFIEAEFWPSLP